MSKTESLFSFLDELQQIHGLRNDDYIKYRRYCTRKLERLRSKFNLHHTSTTKVEVSTELCEKDSEALHLVLFKCEWFLAEINQLRKELSFNSRKKHHLRSICRNSLKYCENLRKLSQESFEIGSNLRLEYLAYANFFEGIVRNELKEFSMAFNLLQRSKVVFEELIEREFAVSVIEARFNELETVLRVCQYSADMYDAVIELDEAALNEFKVNQLTEKLSSTEIKEQSQDYSKSKVSGQKYKIGSSTFEMTPEMIKLTGTRLKMALKARSILKKQVPDTAEYKNAHLQVAYFEDRYYSRFIKTILKSTFPDFGGEENSFESFRALHVLKELSRSEGYNADPLVQEDFNIAAQFFSLLADDSGALNIYQTASKALKIVFHLKKKMRETKTGESFKIRNLKLVSTLRGIGYHNKGRLVGHESAIVPPKPSFYDMAFDCLSYAPDTDVSMANPQESKGIGNLFSSFWGKK